MHVDYTIRCYNERYEIIAIPINSNKFTDFDLKKSKNFKSKKFKSKSVNLLEFIGVVIIISFHVVRYTTVGRIIHLLHLIDTHLNSYSVPCWYSGNRT